jgi:diguanylate cyclase (GGDEF)-like protein
MNPLTLPASVILIVDDLPANLEVLSCTLEDAGAEVLVALDGRSALEQAAYAHPDLILLDVMMPGMDGFETCRRLKSDAQLQEIPVIFTTSLTDIADKVKGLSLGAVDYITKPFQMEEVIARVRNHLQLRQLHQELQHLNQRLEERVQQRTLELQREIEERRQVQDQLVFQANHDSLTRLPNRRYILEQLQTYLRSSAQNPDLQFALLFIDCDRFKVINDSLGHWMGDQLLIAVSERLRSCLQQSPNSLLGRLGGDEFLIVVDRVQDIQEITQFAQSMVQEFQLPFQIENQQIYINLSIGIVMSHGYSEPEALLRDADTAMYQAKQRGRGCYQFFEPQMHLKILQQHRMETALRLALERQEFVLYYQPIIDLPMNRPIGVEALIRWRHPERGQISPGEFIQLAEETGLIVLIGQWVFREACRQLRAWQLDWDVHGSLFMNINLSPRQLLQPDLLDFIQQTLTEFQLSGAQLKLEVTETALFAQVETARQLMQQLQELQIQICLDDFGTGYSSLSHLHRFPVSTLKVDRSFVQGIEVETEKLEIVRAIVAMAHSLHITVVAEGVESEAQQELLKIIGCEMAQGYFLSTPQISNDVGPWLAEKMGGRGLISNEVQKRI